MDFALATGDTDDGLAIRAFIKPILLSLGEAVLPIGDFLFLLIHEHKENAVFQLPYIQAAGKGADKSIKQHYCAPKEQKASQKLHRQNKRQNYCAHAEPEQSFGKFIHSVAAFKEFIKIIIHYNHRGLF